MIYGMVYFGIVSERYIGIVFSPSSSSQQERDSFSLLFHLVFLLPTHHLQKGAKISNHRSGPRIRSQGVPFREL